MAHVNSHAPQYVITAKTQCGIVQETRTMAASALVLARSWLAAGHADVHVTDPQGNLLTPEGYKVRFMEGARQFR